MGHSKIRHRNCNARVEIMILLISILVATLIACAIMFIDMLTVLSNMMQCKPIDYSSIGTLIVLLTLTTNAFIIIIVAIATLIFGGS
jgi:hypothetical protein